MGKEIITLRNFESGKRKKITIEYVKSYDEKTKWMDF